MNKDWKTNSKLIPFVKSTFQGSFKVKFPIMWTVDRWKSRGGKAREKKSRREKIRERESQRKEDAGAQSGCKVVKHGVLPMMCGPGGSEAP